MEIVLLPDKKRTLLVAVFWALLCVLCLYLTNADSRGIKFAILFAAISIFFAVKLYPGVSYLKLTTKGFEYKNYLPARFIEWNDVQNFTTYESKGRLYAGWRYSEFSNRRVINRMGYLLRGIDCTFMENFQQTPKGLVRLLEDWRQEHSDVPQQF